MKAATYNLPIHHCWW